MRKDHRKHESLWSRRGPLWDNPFSGLDLKDLFLSTRAMVSLWTLITTPPLSCLLSLLESLAAVSAAWAWSHAFVYVTLDFIPVLHLFVCNATNKPVSQHVVQYFIKLAMFSYLASSGVSVAPGCCFRLLNSYLMIMGRLKCVFTHSTKFLKVSSCGFPGRLGCSAFSLSHHITVQVFDWLLPVKITSLSPTLSDCSRLTNTL